MPLNITLQLSDRDLELFAARMRAAKSKVEGEAPDEATVLVAVKEMTERIAQVEMSDFVRERINRVDQLARMLSDSEWNLEGEERQRVVNALIYLVDPHDLIPDDMPGLGYLDDAILIELVCKEMRHEMEAFTDFERYRASEAARQESAGKKKGAAAAPATREQWLASRRNQLQDRMRRRRDQLWNSRLGRRLF